MKTEYIRSLNLNYERILLPSSTEERFQYKMIERGGMKNLLDCSIRRIDGDTYLYYDISSKQAVSQIFTRGCITREWMIDFLSDVRSLQQTLYRFLLDMENVLWDINHIYQEMEKNRFSFLYVPYLTEQKSNRDNQFLSICAYLVEHVDYNDTKLVDFTYKLYENMEKNETAYLSAQLWEDLDDFIKGEAPSIIEMQEQTIMESSPMEEDARLEETQKTNRLVFGFPWKRKKERREEERKMYEKEMLNRLENFVVAEPVFYEEETTRTVIMNQTNEKKYPYLMNDAGSIMVLLEKENYLIGKASEKTDILLEDVAVSRMHCRILRDDTTYFLEDLNSTNGTFLNEERLQPYEKRELTQGDSIRCGNTTLFFR